MARVRITQIRSVVGQTQSHRDTLRALGLGRIGRSVERDESRELEGALRKVRHLVTVESAEAGDA